MIFHIQTVLDDELGNCFSTCIACLLDVPVDDVPNFKQIQEDKPLVCMVDESDKWLRSRGLRLICYELYDQNEGETKGQPLTKQCVLNRLAHNNIGELVILSGKSPRKSKDGKTKYHCVIGQASCWGFDIIHDPHPSGEGIVGQPYGVKWIVSLASPIKKYIKDV